MAAPSSWPRSPKPEGGWACKYSETPPSYGPEAFDEYVEMKSVYGVPA